MATIQQVTNILTRNKSRWLGETEIIRLVYPDRRDSQIGDAEWWNVVRCLEEIKLQGCVQSRNIGFNAFVWKVK